MTAPTDGRDRFARLLTPDWVDALDPPGEAAAYTPYVVTWLLVCQRLHAGAPPAAAAFLAAFPAEAEPDVKRVRDGTPSAATGGDSRARLATAAAYPPAANQNGTSHSPVLHLVVAHGLDTGLAVRPGFGPMYGPAGVSEPALTLRLLPRLPARCVVPAGRNFAVSAPAHAAVASGRDLVARPTGPRFRAGVRGAAGERRAAVAVRHDRRDGRGGGRPVPAAAGVGATSGIPSRRRRWTG